MIFIDHFLQLGNKETPYYGTDITTLIDDVAEAYQDAIRDFMTMDAAISRLTILHGLT